MDDPQKGVRVVSCTVFNGVGLQNAAYASHMGWETCREASNLTYVGVVVYWGAHPRVRFIFFFQGRRTGEFFSFTTQLTHHRPQLSASSSPASTNGDAVLTTRVFAYMYAGTEAGTEGTWVF